MFKEKGRDCPSLENVCQKLGVHGEKDSPSYKQFAIQPYRYVLATGSPTRCDIIINVEDRIVCAALPLFPDVYIYI